MFVTAIKDGKFDEAHFMTGGTDKYVEGSPTVELHKAASEFVHKIHRELNKPANKGKEMSIVKIWPLVFSNDAAYKGSVIAFMFCNAGKALIELLGVEETTKGFYIKTGFKVDDLTKLEAYAFKLRGTKFAREIFRNVFNTSDYHTLIPAEFNGDEAAYEKVLWEKVRGTRKNERDLELKSVADQIFNEIINKYCPGLSPEDQKQKLTGLFKVILDYNKLDKDIYALIQKRASRWGGERKFDKYIIKDLQDYISKL
jgi:hypothetical protein